MEKRFNTDALDVPIFLSASELDVRNREVDELTKKGMAQKILVNSVKIEKDKISVDADRILSVAKIRSALPLPVTVKIKQTDRSNGNPFGHVLSDVSMISTEEKK
jgi:tetrahydromethanopterin S-methyltransferase subunit H